MTPETEHAFQAIRAEYGADSLSRVERMLEPGGGPARRPLQAGARWILPGISPTPWHEPTGHPELAQVVAAFEAAHPVIKDELTAAWSGRRDVFADYEHYLTRQEDWQALYLYRGGGLVAESADTVPTAYRVLEEFAVGTEKICPLLECHFSTLLPGAVIAPHCDLWNFSINLHLAVDIPDGCSITVAGETRSWEEGKCLLFDYSFEHEARNSGDRPRTCLLVDLWHPETTVPERRALTVLITEVRRLMEDL
ncbi:aspartyl/asparaginyl beta-hydroxylase domain-containing protein [Streptomyces olivaceus]|uniref:aspartyl/asparaginyl beta-hydroxylase domain-containing protein n=1 Tax=Streptomyces olivaceus TaxID=47716 RepID=UPI001CCBAF5A|nr:aspartyl/asparaginyl beta-hydroxylase domain-containing protein [Streptomyces olivaceus]MBZ6200049.1 aspartyl/asparaginyl beta-hydroxylase domain-containing protein [Streptomyces olivaceus]MBZ6282255.1 aspartyl/asparaginyl beta-hydroxylase domain-containing protein [Streptomyces olivaceus]